MRIRLLKKLKTQANKLYRLNLSSDCYDIIYDSKENTCILASFNDMQNAVDVLKHFRRSYILARVQFFRDEKIIKSYCKRRLFLLV